MEGQKGRPDDLLFIKRSHRSSRGVRSKTKKPEMVFNYNKSMSGINRIPEVQKVIILPLPHDVDQQFLPIQFIHGR